MRQADASPDTDSHCPTAAARVALSGLTCWGVTDGKAGMEIQCKGLAEALGFTPDIKRVSVTKPWRWLPAGLIRDPLATLGPKGDRLAPPWPDLWIASGRQTVPLTRDLRKQSGGRSFTVQIQTPAIDPAAIDLIVTPEHVRLRAANVLTTRGSLGQVTPQRLAEAAARFGPRYAQLPEKRIGVLIGGDNKVFRLDSRTMTKLTDQLAALARAGWGLMITPSRRTGERNEAILRRGLAGLPADIWDGPGDTAGENPYFGILALADHLVVTGDSVNMVSEAASTGKPVHVVDLQGHAPKFSRFHQALQEAGITRPFSGELEEWTYTPLAETQRAAEEIRRRLLDHLAQRAA
ncbi:MAG: mitochondrial fission ELM1 family protein [Kiloniellaceae bacterium]